MANFTNGDVVLYRGMALRYFCDEMAMPPLENGDMIFPLTDEEDGPVGLLQTRAPQTC